MDFANAATGCGDESDEGPCDDICGNIERVFYSVLLLLSMVMLTVWRDFAEHNRHGGNNNK
jgi:hypothetical protein